MFCPVCRTPNADTSPKCSGCGHPLQSPPPAYPQAPGYPQGAPGYPQGAPPMGQPMGMPPMGGPPIQVPNYLVHSIIATILCCPIPGIVGIIYASQVNSKLAQGDVQGAMNASSNARTWTIVAFALGFIGAIVQIIAVIAAAQQGQLR